MTVIRRISFLAGALALSPIAAMAMDLRLPFGATLEAERFQEFASYPMPVSGWSDGAFESVPAEGAILRQAWRIDASKRTTLQILDGLRTQLVDAGYELLFECAATECGGFDFRFDTEILPEPAMHVDLGDYRFLAAKKPAAENAEYVSLVVSRSSTSGFVQIIQVGAQDTQPEALSTSTKGASAPQELNLGNLPEQLEKNGSIVLDDLAFATGSSALDGDDFASLAALSDYLKRNPNRTIALVGHTDSEGALAGNVALSKKRASSVVALLRDKHGVNSNQISAEGMGFLAPRASNLTEEGRTHNRRVEAILTSTQ
ncbi:OmpA family protein [Falsihalocynthiibacter sp. SS001]|uniref:OmpA family protein n=1 Tax=Falsihalocynthiibacter sp. SS001 TaxID=3349698 RepID=UPI0036D3676A